MAYSEKKQKGEIRDLPKGKMYGSEGNLGLVGGIAGRIVKGFANTAKQYLKGFKKPKATSNFKEFHRGGRVYDRQAINDAFKARFKPEARVIDKIGPNPPKIESKTMHRNIFGTKFIGTKVTPKTNFGRPDATVQMRNAMRKSGQYPKSDPYRGAPGLR